MTLNGLPLDPAEMEALQFLDRHSGDWYCTLCWAGMTGADARRLYRLSVLMGTDRALLAGYQARADGPCKIHDAMGSRAGGVKGRRCVRSLGKVTVPRNDVAANDATAEEVGR